MLELLPTAKFECDIIGCQVQEIATKIGVGYNDQDQQHYWLPEEWQAYNKYNSSGKLIPYHICHKHKIFKRR